VTILVHEAYKEASRRSAEWAERELLRRFAQVYGERAQQVLAGIRDRMDSNIRSDGRPERAPILKAG
jgi:hypothetical protein